MTKSKDGKDFGKKAKDAYENAKHKVQNSIKNFKKNETVKDLHLFATKHKRDTAVYVILLIGLLVSLFKPFLGQAIIGVVVGIYFFDELVSGSKRINNFVEQQGVFRIVIFAFTAIVLFLAAPGIFLGAALAIGIRILIAPK